MMTEYRLLLFKRNSFQSILICLWLYNPINILHIQFRCHFFRSRCRLVILVRKIKQLKTLQKMVWSLELIHINLSLG